MRFWVWSVRQQTMSESSICNFSVTALIKSQESKKHIVGKHWNFILIATMAMLKVRLPNLLKFSQPTRYFQMSRNVLGMTHTESLFYVETVAGRKNTLSTVYA
jgi:hypothetical protein